MRYISMPGLAFNLQNHSFIRDESLALLVGVCELICIFLEQPLSNYAYFSGAARLVVCLFHNVAPATFTRKAADKRLRLLLISYWSGSHEWAPNSGFHSK
jgi:dolichol kinase